MLAALPELKRFIATSTNSAERLEAVLAVESIDERPETVVPFLVACLEHQAPDVRKHAAGLLLRHLEAAKSTVPRLIWMAKNDVPEVRESAAHALNQIAKEAALREGIKDPFPGPP